MSRANELPIVGWREWVALPGLGVPLLRAKVDTGARTSSLHAEEVEVFTRAGRKMVRFLLRTRRNAFRCEAPLAEQRSVRSSSGHEELRLVVVAECVHGRRRWPIELTLTDRTPMKFPMLLGRAALAGRFVVDPSRSFTGGKPGRSSRA